MFFCSALYFVYLCWCFKVHSCILFCCYLNVHHCILFKGFHLDCVFQDYTLEGEFGFATDNFSRTGRIVERSTYGVYNFAPRLRLCIELVLGLYNSVGESSWCVQITSHRTSWRKSWPCCSRPIRRRWIFANLILCIFPLLCLFLSCVSFGISTGHCKLLNKSDAIGKRND